MRPELTVAFKLLSSGSPSSRERALELMQRTVFTFSMTVCGHSCGFVPGGPWSWSKSIGTMSGKW
jgi:hypothetical protein